MATYILPPSQVKSKIVETSFENGDTIIVRGVPGDTVIKWGDGDFVTNKYFNLICDQDPTPLPDPFGYAILGQTPKTWRTRSIAPVTMTGALISYLLPSFLYDFRNMNWQCVDFPDWVGKGQTWKNMGYNYGALFYARPSTETGSNARVRMTDMHFEGPREFNPNVADPWGDSPPGYYYLYSSAANGDDDKYNGMCRADGANISPFISKIGAPGRGPWPGVATELRNKRYLAEFGTDICYNALSGLPTGIIMPFAAELIMDYCSFRNLAGGYSADPRKDGSFNVQANKPWFENLYGDYIHISGQGRAQATEAQSEFWYYKEWGAVMTGQGNCAGQDLGNPHVDYRQFYGTAAANYLPRVMISHSVNDAGGQVGKPHRSGAQDIFDGGGARMHQLKVYKHLNINARDKAYGQSADSLHCEGLQGLVIPKAPKPINVDSAGVYPAGSNNAFIMGASTGGLLSRGLVKDTNIGSFVFKYGANPRLVNVKYITGTTNPDAPILVPTTIAPDANVEMRCLAESYAKCRQPSWPADIVDFLNSGLNFDDLTVCATPAYLDGAPVGQVLTSPKERIHIGDFDAVAPIEIVTPGLQWAMYDFVGTGLVTDFNSNPGTVKDGQHLALRVPPIATGVTAKDYYYKINGQLLKWTAVTVGDWKIPKAQKGAAGQWSKTAAGALISGATDEQNKKGIVLFRWQLPKPATFGSAQHLIFGTSGRTMRVELNTTDLTGYNIDFGFANSGGSRIGTVNTGRLEYDVEYEAFYTMDVSLETNNTGLIVRRVSDQYVMKPWAPTNTTVTLRCAWDYNQVAGADGTGFHIAWNNPLILTYLAIVGGVSLLQDDGNGGMQIYDPGPFSAERLGVRGFGLCGVRPQVFLPGETTPNNRGSAGAFSVTATAGALTDVGGGVWANPPGTGPKLVIGWDDVPSATNEGETITATLKAYGSNEPFTATLALPAGVTLVGGGNTVTFAENERAKSIQLKFASRGNKTIGVTNNVGYGNPGDLTLPVGVLLSFTVLPAAGYAGDPYPVTVRFAPA